MCAAALRLCLLVALCAGLCSAGCRGPLCERGVQATAVGRTLKDSCTPKKYPIGGTLLPVSGQGGWRTGRQGGARRRQRR